MVSPRHSGVVLKEHTLDLFTGFRWSTMIKQNTSLDNVYCSAKIKIALIHIHVSFMPLFKLLEIKEIFQL